MTDVMDKIAKLKAMADSAQAIGNTEEAAAFAGKVAELLTTHKLSMGEVELRAQNKNDPIAKKWSPQSKRRRIQWEEDLALVVSKAHFCRLLISRDSNSVCFVGRETDRKVAEWIFNYLKTQADMLAKRELRRYRRELKKEFGHHRDAHGFEAAFVLGFTAAVAGRYYDEAERTSGSTALVRARKDVDEWMENQSFNRPAKKLNTQRRFNERGQTQGAQAGRSANIRGHGLKDGDAAKGKELGGC